MIFSNLTEIRHIFAIHFVAWLCSLVMFINIHPKYLLGNWFDMKWSAICDFLWDNYCIHAVLLYARRAQVITKWILFARCALDIFFLVKFQRFVKCLNNELIFMIFCFSIWRTIESACTRVHNCLVQSVANWLITLSSILNWAFLCVGSLFRVLLAVFLSHI